MSIHCPYTQAGSRPQAFARLTASGRKRVLLIAASVAVVAAGSLWLSNQPKEPEYKGRRLSEWIQVCVKHPGSVEALEARDAIRHIGTNAVPWLVKWIDSDTPEWRLKLACTLGKRFPSFFQTTGLL